MKFGGQTSKNDNDVRRARLRLCLCVLMFLREFYVIVFLRTKVGFFFDLEDLVYRFKVRARPHLGPIRVPT